MTNAQTSEASFDCAVCGELAGQVRFLRGGQEMTDRSRPSLDALAEIDQLLRPKDQAAVVVDTFYGVDSQPVTDNADGVAAAVAAGDASALRAIAYRYAPFHCPECAASYCARHWAARRFEDGDIEGIEGTCPQGHFHVLRY